MLKVAIIGAGAISDKHIQGYLQFKDMVQIVSLVDSYPEKARQKADKYGLDASIFDDHQEMLAVVEFDLASVCTPPFAHATVAVDLLNHGKHVLVEKPMATCLQECDEMIAAAKANQRLLSVVAQNRFKTPWMKLKQVVASGKIGRIVHAQIDSFWWRGSNYYDLWWRGTWEKEGGGCTMNHAVHHIDLFQWIVGYPSELQSIVANLVHDNSEVEDFSTAILFYKNGTLGQVSASLVHHGEKQQMVVQGERAMVSIPWEVQASKQMENGFPEKDLDVSAEIQSYYESLPDLAHSDHNGQIANLLNAIEGTQELIVDGQEGRKTLELVTAIYKSGITGQKVKLPLTPQDPFYTRQGILEKAPHFHEKTRSVENFATDEITFARDVDKPG
jgi:UDP-N-acetyl-2-amino-2-deoxyglucuronate dehydrogenase